MDSNLQSFVKEGLARGIPRQAMREQLARAGWKQDEVEAALSAFAEVDFPIPVPRPLVYLGAREAFLYLLMFLALFVSAFNLGALAFEFIERALPDPLRAQGMPDSFRSQQIRQATASLLIAFPLFAALSRLLLRSMSRDPEKRSSKIRKWLTYVTLFIAAGTLMGDLIVLVAGLLQGELTLSFALKVGVVFLIAGTAFIYYLWGLREEEVETQGTAGAIQGHRRRIFVPLTYALVGAAVVAGLFYSGPPQMERRRRLDEARVQNLQTIEAAVDRFWESNHRLPGGLEELRSSPNTFITASRDPGTGAPYRYVPVDSASFNLCAVFESDSRMGTSPDSGFWSHPAGPRCYLLRTRGLGDPGPKPYPAR